MPRMLLNLVVINSLVGLACTARGDDSLVTVAERSGYKATARYDEVAAWCRAFAKACPNARMSELAVSSEGRSIPLLIVADPPVKTAEEARASGKLVCLIIGNIHAGEVCGKEALPMLLRDEFAGTHPPLLKDLILAVAPIYNADGNEKVSKTNRPGQVGPEEGMGQRANGRGLDLNRDFIKLEAPETRGLVRFLNDWNPHLFIDTHTTNGSHHRYTVTYEGPKSPAGDPRIVEFMRQTFFPQLGAAFEKETGLKAFYYGNFNRDHTTWTTYPAEARYGTTYFGLRNRLSVLSEAYSYAPYKTRVLATRDFVKECLKLAVARKSEIVKLLDSAGSRSTPARRAAGGPAVEVALRSKMISAPGKANLLGYVEREINGHRERTDEARDYSVDLVNQFGVTLKRERPFAYLIPAEFSLAVEAVKRHGLAVEELREDILLEVEVDKVDAIEHGRKFEGHQTTTLATTARKESRVIKAGTLLVRAAQSTGTLASYLLEPQSEDGLATWNLFDQGLAVGGDYPVVRLLAPATILTTAADVLPEARPAPRPITFAMANGRGGRGFRGMRTNWLDHDHWLADRGGQLVRIEAATGKAEPFFDPQRVAAAIARVPGIDLEAAQEAVRETTNPFHRTTFEIDPAYHGFLFEHDQDLFYATFDGKTAVRLTNHPGPEQWPQFSPDLKKVAFVRDYDLYTVDLATHAEHRLTTGGREDFRHGHADWVYFEEIFNRRWPAFWWSPDSKKLAFLEFDASGVPVHTVLDDTETPRRVEQTRYPRAGETNPRVRLGIVPANGGPISWADLAGYTPDAFLISEVGWFADSHAAYCYAQDRAQTWLDLLSITPSGDKAPVTRLFRDKTKAWIESPGPLHPYRDNGFLWLSERDGYKHIYEYASDGSLKGQLTSGPYEVRAIERVNPGTGLIYFTATKDDPTGGNFYRMKPGGPIERLTPAAGSHSVSMSPDESYFIDDYSDVATPPRKDLRGGGGKLVRVLDSNPSHELKRLKFGPRERIKIPAGDGFPLEAELILPPDLDPAKKHPVWFMTYAGPHAPTVSDSWNGGRMWDQALASEGFIVFRMDPRGASGKGAVSAWTGYKKLGVHELEDITAAIEWLKRKPYVDGARIGMAGHSYGGYITSFAMTHSKLFAAGIAGAPVTDWRDYDSIYTERYMGLPQDNPDGYNASSVVRAAANLHGKLLILHGAIDDNVSLRNTMRFVKALEDADKDFELMIYPSSRHGIFGAHYSRLQIDFIRRTLGDKPAGKKPSSAADMAGSRP